ncbi:hypothetical protein [Hyphomicrobium sp. ghe19]|uniref:hypothetical protein n=1 Tax=Hyphomicrobium sp. ghe19 TaxID=2682968 RepID=UPI001366F82B|nr:hypothetical protein HYPP_03124 [Hyphomicrobium sp. ghe19]
MSAGLQGESKSGAAISDFARLCLRVSLAALAVLLCYLVLTRTFVSYLNRVDPSLALAIRGSDAEAELKLARIQLASAEERDGDGHETTEQIRQRLLHALSAEPLNAAGFELLGVVSAQARDTASATAFMQAASARSRRTPGALLWLMHQKFAEGDTEAAIAYGDALLRIQPKAISGVVPAFAQIAEMPSGADQLIATLSTRPPWRENVLYALNGKTSKRETPLMLLSGLKKSEYPPTAREIGAYLRYLIDARNYEIAYYSWLQLLAPEQLGSAGLLFNGGFRLQPSGLPFDWTIEGGSGAIAEIAIGQGPKETNALSLELGGGRVDFRPIYQLILLAPGRYRLVGLSKGHLKGLRGLQWQIACLEKRSEAVGVSEPFLAGSSVWTEFTAAFEIHAGCKAQVLRLVLDARSASETFVSGSFAFAGLRITRDEA